MATVGELDIAIRGKSTGLDNDLRVVERKVRTSGDRMGKEMDSAFKLGKLMAGLRVFATLAESQFNAVGFAAAVAGGDIRRMAEEVDYLADTFKQLPLLGDALRAGQGIGVSNTFKSLQSGAVDLGVKMGLISPEEAARTKEGISGRKTDAQQAAEVEQESKIAEARRIQNLKIIEDAQKRIRNLTRETALLNAGDDNARKRLQAEFRLEDDLSGIDRVPEEQREQLRRLAEQRFRLETRNLEGTGAGGRGQEISARTALSTRPPDQQQPNKRQVDTTNQILQNIARIIGNLENRTVAQ